MADDTFDLEGDGGAPFAEPANDGRIAGGSEARPAFGRSAIGAVWQEGVPGHWVIKLRGLPGAESELEVTLGRPDASNHSPSITDRVSVAGRVDGIGIAWIESRAGHASGVGRVMWQSIGAIDPAAPAAIANDNAAWVTDLSGAGVMGFEPTITGLTTGETLLTWIGTDGHAHGRLYVSADVDAPSRIADGSDAQHAAANAWLGDLGPVAAAPEDARRLQVAELRPGAFAVMWLALGEGGPTLRGSLFVIPAGTEGSDDLAWTSRSLADVRLPPGSTGQFSLAPAGEKDAGLQALFSGPGTAIVVDVFDHVDGVLAREHVGELGPAGLPGPAAGAGESDKAHPTGAAAHVQGEQPESYYDHGRPATTALAIATAPGVSDTAPIMVQAVQEGFAVGWQAPGSAVQAKLTSFSLDSIAKGPEILASHNVAADVTPAITCLGDCVAAGYVVAGDGALVVEVFAGDGTQIGEAVVDSGDTGAIVEIALGSNGEDALAVVYVQQSSDAGGTGGYGNIMLQRYAVGTEGGGSELVPLGRDGMPDGNDAPAQLTIEGDDPSATAPVVGRGPSVCGVDDGELAIIWVERDGERETIKGTVLDPGGLQVLRIDLTGLLEGVGIAVGTEPTLLDAGDGDILVSWLQPDGDDGGYVVMSALYNETSPGAWLVPEQAVRLKAFDTLPKDYSVAVSSDDGGQFINVIWTEDGRVCDGDNVYNQRYDIDGNGLGRATRVAEDDAVTNEQPLAGETLAAAGVLDGQIVVVYTEQELNGDLALAAHVIDVSAPPETSNSGGTADAIDLADKTFSTGIDQETAINPLGNQIGADLTISHINGVPITTATPVDIGSGWIQLREDGWLTVTPDAGYTGQVAFDYTVAGATNGTDTDGRVVVNVEASEAPVAVTLLNQVKEVPEDMSMAADLKVADIAMADGELGTDGLSITGLDADMFKIVGNALYLKEGIELDFEAKPTLSIEIQASHSDELDGAASFTLSAKIASETPASEAIGDTLEFVPGYGDTGGEHQVVDLGNTEYATFRELLESGALVQPGDDVVILDAGDPADPLKTTSNGVPLPALNDSDFKLS